jgi:hypothetical protein
LLLVACSYQKAGQTPISDRKPVISLGDVDNILKEQGFELKDSKLLKNNVLLSELNGVSPKNYSLGGKLLSIYVFPSETERGKGIQSFENSKTKIELKNYKAYGIENVLVFLVGGDEEAKTTLFDALKKLER